MCACVSMFANTNSPIIDLIKVISRRMDQESMNTGLTDTVIPIKCLPTHYPLLHSRLKISLKPFKFTYKNKCTAFSNVPPDLHTRMASIVVVLVCFPPSIHTTIARPPES